MPASCSRDAPLAAPFGSEHSHRQPTINKATRNWRVRDVDEVGIALRLGQRAAETPSRMRRRIGSDVAHALLPRAPGPTPARPCTWWRRWARTPWSASTTARRRRPAPSTGTMIPCGSSPSRRCTAARARKEQVVALQAGLQAGVKSVEGWWYAGSGAHGGVN